MSRLVLRCVVACIAVVTACAGGPPSTVGERRSSNVITATDIASTQASQASTAYDLIAALRPDFLRSRGSMSPTNPIPPKAEVYVDGVHFGDIESLKTLTVIVLKRIEYLNALDATTRFGTNNAGGAILITTR
jgi:hypothetical protein